MPARLCLCNFSDASLLVLVTWFCERDFLETAHEIILVQLFCFAHNKTYLLIAFVAAQVFRRSFVNKLLKSIRAILFLSCRSMSKIIISINNKIWFCLCELKSNLFVALEKSIKRFMQITAGASEK